jgi:hypothetical protein
MSTAVVRLAFIASMAFTVPRVVAIAQSFEKYHNNFHQSFFFFLFSFNLKTPNRKEKNQQEKTIKSKENPTDKNHRSLRPSLHMKFDDQ